MEKQEMMAMMKQMMARMDSSTKTMQEKMDDSQVKADQTLKETLAKMEFDRKTAKEEMNANNKRMLAEITETMQEKMDANQAKMDANRKIHKKEIIEEMKASQKETLAKMEAERKSDLENLKSWMGRMMDTEETGVKLQELTETVESTHRECEEPTSANTMACQGNMEARLEKEDKPALVDTTLEVAQEEEVPREDAV
jgi:hypothetical protein